MIQFKEAKHMQKLKKLRLRSEEALIKVYAKKYGIKYIDLSGIPMDTDALKIIPQDRAIAAGIAGFKIINRDISVAIRSPFPTAVKEEIKKLEDKKYVVHIYMASKRSITRAWSRYGDISYSVKTKKGVIDISSADISDVLSQIKTVTEAKSIINESIKSEKSYRISKVIEVILYTGYSLGASDIHIETSEKFAQVRFRLDGVLVKVAEFDLATFRRILSRIKLTAGLKINVKENAQDGRFTIKMSDKDVEMRTSTLPDAYGESVVMRILDPSAITVPLEALGMLPYFLNILSDMVKKPNGMIINTGPTGSGKTTTLFALLRKVISPDVKIITIEDPIEYHVEGVTQTQVNKEKGYTFLSGLRSVLRQDPDVIMIGEIRDGETAAIAINSALTGHLVLSTLHTNSAAGAFPRFLDLGMDPKILATAINISLAQRLLRKLCTNCKVPVDLFSKKNNELGKKVKKIFSEIKNKDKFLNKDKDYIIYSPVGCSKCNETGYKGRVAVVEAILMDRGLEELLKTKPTEREIRSETMRQGILTMKEDGVIKVIDGTTSITELDRILRL